ncbi:MAG: type II toxin-antitoxin system Phd/YefM family antitoxin [Thermodesulfobacteriota bacterium]|nr:type II toxin-antitoxin system Phd/YefM family antitoxin [Thermodesulfobacteriota bacterium]
MQTEIVTTLKRQATRILADIRQSREPVLITEHGKPSAYLIDAESYDLMQDRMKILDGIAKGERALLEDRLYTQKQAKDKMKKWLT